MTAVHYWLGASVLAGVMLAGAGLGAQAAAPATPAPAQAGNVETGRKLFTSYGCYQCHGYEGQGSSATGARLAPNPFPLQAFIAYVRRPAGQMPFYSSKIVPDADLVHIHAFLSSRPAPPPVSSLPLLR
jgi:ubiquinol-cytochrome c reductase cytochrome c subunit